MVDSSKTSTDGPEDTVDADSREKPQEQDLEKNIAEQSKKEEAFLVKFEDNESSNPRNWSNPYKAWITLQLGFLAFTGSVGSSIISPAAPILADEFGISQEVVVLTVALYVLGFALGPMMWGPISEVYGRKWSMLPAVAVLGLFSIGTATSRNAQSLFLTRFFGGLFGSSPISNVSAALGDMYEPKARGLAMTFYAVMVVGGPTLGPVVGSALTNNKALGWRSTMYAQAMFVAVMVLTTFFAMPEVYGPVLLKRKAKRVRKETGDERFWHPHEAEKIRLNNVINKYFSRPLRMLVTEPVVASIACYASFVYGILYLTLEVFPIVFREQRGYSLVLSSLPFLGLFVGVLCAVGINLANQGRYAKAVEKNNGRSAPDARLPPMVVGGVLFTAGLFFFGWTAAPEYHWILPVVAAGLIGAGFNTIFQQCINVLVDTYGLYAASATAANTFLRSLFAFGLPLVAGPMFRNLGVGPAASVLGGISCLGLPVPFIFMAFGDRLRKNSKFAPAS
ncbi:related to fluconazole resistance protein [Ramularia collo-cygni]|uniref:Cercosporin MFS transporter CTB4 n=1 Tax=Ramularia collo-cygni TaxID=112498 RepID=A0A2D3VPE4_9PEZI|nr:related to fluconazole resistance protein [Ramularia collo-cygni]CZT23798.1 related to fluconazole resistance protein [Ramularia collo-cygni]